MRKSTITAVFRTDIQKVWATVTDNTRYAWRSDLEKIETLDKDKFIEIPQKDSQRPLPSPVKNLFNAMSLI